ncbi:hypothetical protein SGFS_059240 [Streptomyces graminofaciens]|uniref:Uncharacterized protein n=1 Tax=Streptomyces graminofaciens TaxID=68212 RepID=A0ABN5VME6_9ACTN|nr:hypothetical protein SGFS_059240 [Streptomyces graminofaciens]
MAVCGACGKPGGRARAEDLAGKVWTTHGPSRARMDDAGRWGFRRPLSFDLRVTPRGTGG